MNAQFCFDAFEEEESSIRDVVSTNGFSMSKPLGQSDWTTTRLRASSRARIPLCYGLQWPLRGGGGQGRGGVLGHGEVGKRSATNLREADLEKTTHGLVAGAAIPQRDFDEV
jgi:hypothetical protein